MYVHSYYLVFMSPSCTCTAGVMSPWNAGALDCLQGQLMDHVLMHTGLDTKLQKKAGGFMTRAEAQTVTCLQSDRDQVKQLINILQGKEDEQFLTFCKMLREANYSGWAEKLASEAESRRMAALDTTM